MRALIVVAALLLLVSPALAEQKSAPDGFGPIKFGMTKDEAWEAIGGQGEWADAKERDGISGEYLVHKVGIPEYLKEYFEVKHRFLDGRAIDVTLFNTDTQLPFASCVTFFASFLGAITSKYGVHPLGFDYETDGYPSPSIHQVDIYQFSYEDNSFVQATLMKTLERTVGEVREISCKLFIQYAPPQKGLLDGF